MHAEKCPVCDGCGNIGETFVKCHGCGGKGWVEVGQEGSDMETVSATGDEFCDRLLAECFAPGGPGLRPKASELAEDKRRRRARKE